MNFTVVAPEGTQNHGNPKLICTPPNWKDYLVFFMLNYFIHAVTLPARPGESTKEMIFAFLNAFFIPGFGVTRALRRLILRPGLIRHNNLGQAVAAGALCMVVSDRSSEKFATRSSGWLPDTFVGEWAYAEVPRSRKMHGRCIMPKGYRLLTLPLDSPLKSHTGTATLRSVRPAHPTEPKQKNMATSMLLPADQDLRPLISHTAQEEKKSSPFRGLNLPQIDPLDDFAPSCEYSIAKALFGIVQAVAGILTLYHARGDLLQRYGYGAFSLSVVPYVFMSVTNFTATMLCPTYQTMYLVHTPDMDEAELLGGSFDGVVARLDVAHDFAGARKPYLGWDRDHFGEIVLFNLIGILVPLAIVGGLSGFKAGDQSTSAQRGWLMSWLVLGSISSTVSWLFEGGLRSRFWAPLIMTAPTWIPAIGGMVTVGLQMREYGSCIRIDE